METWESSKENIQPLSAGRKMSVLTHTLDGTNHEKEFLERQSQLEQQILEYEGQDELEPWIHYITFLEQACPTGGKMSAKYDAVLGQCCSKFFGKPEYGDDKRFVDIYLKKSQKVPLEKRVGFLKLALDRGFGAQVSQMYISIANDLESLQNYPQASNVLQKGIEANAQPIECLREALNNLQYRVAEKLSKSLQKPNNNESDGFVRNFGHSVPVCSMSNEAQNVRVALSPARGIYGIKPNNMKSDKRKIPLFESVETAVEMENVENAQPRNLLTMNPVHHQELIRNEQENNLKTKKWCDEVFSQPPVIPSAQQDKIQIYEDEPGILPRVEMRKKIDKGILSERKILPTDDTVSSSSSSTQSIITSAKIVYRKDQLRRGNREITFTHLRVKEYLAKKGLTTVKALLCEPVSKVQRVQSTNVAATDLKTEQLEKERISLKSQLEEHEKKFQHLQDQKIKDSEQILKQHETIENLKETIDTIKISTNKMQEIFQMKITELEKILDRNEQELTRINQDNQELKVLLANEIQTKQILVNEKEQMRLQFEEEKLKMQQNFDRERNESLLNFSQKLDKNTSKQEVELQCSIIHNGTQVSKSEERNYHHHQQQQQQTNHQNIKSITSGKVSPLSFPGTSYPIQATQSNFCPFTVYESKLEFTEIMENNNNNNDDDENTFPKPISRPTTVPTTCNNNNNYQSSHSMMLVNNENEYPQFNNMQSHLSLINNNNCEGNKTPTENIATHFDDTENDNIPPSPPPPSTDEDKENLFQCPLEKPKRVKSGVLQPSTTADPMELIFTEPEEDEVIVKKHEETGQDFNISDLTRALQFFPRPLVNSTPEKQNFSDVTCDFRGYVPRNCFQNPSRKSSLFKTMPSRSSTQESLQPQNDQELGHDFQEQFQQNLQSSTATTATTNLDPFLADIQPIHYDEEDGPSREIYSRRPYGRSFGVTENLPYNLSPIQETSKERWTSTSSSSSNNMTNTRAVNYSSYNMTKSVTRPGRYSGH